MSRPEWATMAQTRPDRISLAQAVSGIVEEVRRLRDGGLVDGGEGLWDLSSRSPG